MKLQVKLALYNAISKALIILAIGLVIPLIIERVVLRHMDKRLLARRDKMMMMIGKGGLNEITLDQDCSFDSYSVFKEEYVSISPLTAYPKDFGKPSFRDTTQLIENEAVKHRVLRQAFLYDNQLYQLQIGEGMSTIDQLNHTIRNFTVDLMLVVVLISIFLDIGFVQLILRPFNRIINEKLRQMNHPTGYRPVSIKTNTYEFNYLDRSIDEMMQKVQESFRTEREFITNVSHELLTPVSILRNRVENILNDPNVPEEIQAKMVESQKTLSRLTRVVKALLYISKIDNDQYLRNEEADLQELMTDLVAELEDRVHEKDLRLVQEWVDPFVVRNCNRSLLHTLLLNLVSNAIKYNKPGGRISIRGWSGEQHYVLTIQDSGVGIREEQLPFIFDRFKRFRPEDGMSYGLGLPIVRSIAQIHEIDVDVQSEPEVGTTFTLRFPLV